MQLSKSKSHGFHFIMDQVMYQNLSTVQVFIDQLTVSELIVRILHELYPLLEKEHFSGNERDSHYEFVHENKKLERRSVHVNMPRSLYRRLKLIHQDLDFYSIAQLVRFIIRLFLDMVNRYGTNFKQMLARRLKSWQQQVKVIGIKIKTKQQLLRILECNLNSIKLISLYNSFFSPILIYKC